MPDHKNIHEAILAVMKKVGYVRKTKSGGLNYSFAGEAALIQALRPALLENGIYLHITGVLDPHSAPYTTSKGSAMNDVALTLVGRFTHAPSGTYIEVAARGEGADTGDKASSKASTMAYKYLLRQSFLIETGDEADKEQPESRGHEPVHTHAEFLQELEKRGYSRSEAVTVLKAAGITSYKATEHDKALQVLDAHTKAVQTRARLANGEV